MTIYLIRHGESTSDTKNRYDGDYDDCLTESGLQDARKIAEKLKKNDIEIVFSSPKIRAIETAKIINSTLGCKIAVMNDLAEQDIYGAYLDLGKNQPEEEYRKLGEILVNRNNVVEGAESYKDFKDRTINCFSNIINQPFKAIAIVTHGGPIRCIFREILKLGEFEKIGNGAIIELKKKGHIVSVVSIDNAILKF